MAVRYYLNTRSGTGNEPAGLAIVVLRGNRQIKVLTPVRVRPRDWSKKQQKIKATVPGSAETNGALARLRSDVEALALSFPSDEDLRQVIRERLGKSSGADTIALLGEFIEHKRARYKGSTLQVYDSLKQHIEGFLEGRRRDVTTIGPGWLDDFQVHLLKAGVQNSTANKLVTRAKGFLRWLHERELISRMPAVKPLDTPSKFVVHLTSDELAKLRNVDLSGQQPGYAKARDLFLFACFTGQRFSDISAMRWGDIQNDVWNLHVKKTNVTLRVPLARPAAAIIEQYRGQDRPLPQLSNQKMNAYLKEVCRLAKIEGEITIHRQSGGERVAVQLAKADAISSHAARRTFITLALESGLSLKELLGFTHQDLKSLKLYAGVNEERRKAAIERAFAQIA